MAFGATLKIRKKIRIRSNFLCKTRTCLLVIFDEIVQGLDLFDQIFENF